MLHVKSVWYSKWADWLQVTDTTSPVNAAFAVISYLGQCYSHADAINCNGWCSQI